MVALSPGCSESSSSARHRLPCVNAIVAAGDVTSPPGSTTHLSHLVPVSTEAWWSVISRCRLVRHGSSLYGRVVANADPLQAGPTLLSTGHAGSSPQMRLLVGVVILTTDDDLVIRLYRH